MMRKPMMMWCVGLSLALIGHAPPAWSEDDPQLAARRAAKLAQSWVTRTRWRTDRTQARAEARRSGKLVFAYFTRSYRF